MLMCGPKASTKSTRPISLNFFIKLVYKARTHEQKAIFLIIVTLKLKPNNSTHHANKPASDYYKVTLCLFTSQIYRKPAIIFIKHLMKNPVSDVRFYNLKQRFGNNSDILRSSTFIQVYEVQRGQM